MPKAKKRRRSKSKKPVEEVNIIEPEKADELNVVQKAEASDEEIAVTEDPLKDATEPKEPASSEGDDEEDVKSSKDAERNQDASNEEVADSDEGADNDADSVDFAQLQGIGLSDDSDMEDVLRVVDVSKLKPQTTSIAKNDEPAMDRKLADIALFDTVTPHGVGKLPFRESLSTTLALKEPLPDSLAANDLERERKFAELATEAVHSGLGRLRSLGVKFRRPDDYFAQMIKTDDHMTRVKTHLLAQRDSIRAAEKRRHDREGLKNRRNESKAQRLAAQERNKKTNEEIQAVSKLRKDRVKKRAADAMDDSDDEFPIHLLEEGVEQLDSDNRFANIRDIASGKKKAWSGNAKGNSSFMAKDKGGPSAKNGPKKKKGSKKRLGKKRRLAASAKA